MVNFFRRVINFQSRVFTQTVIRPSEFFIRAHSAEGLKKAGRGAAPIVAKATPAITGVFALVASFIPYVGPIVALGVTAAGAGIGRYAGATGARARGYKGAEARRKGAQVRNRAVIYGLTGATLGLGATLLTGTGAFLASTATADGALMAGEAGAVNSAEVAGGFGAEGAIAAPSGTFGAGAAAQGGSLAAEQAAILNTSLVTDQIVASQAVATASAAKAGVALTAFGNAAVLPGATAASAEAAAKAAEGASGGGWFADVLKTVGGIASPVLLKLLEKVPGGSTLQNELAPYIGGNQGGAPGDGGLGTDAGAGGAEGLPVAKIALVTGAALLVGFGVYKFAKKAA